DDIRQEIEKHNERGQKYGCSEDHCIVAIEGSLHIKTAEAGNLEDRFHYERATQQSSKSWPEIADHREQTGSQTMFEHHAMFWESLGPSCAQIILGHDLEHARTAQASNIGRVHGSECHAGQYLVAG